MKKAWVGFGRLSKRKGFGYGLLGFTALIALVSLLHAQTAIYGGLNGGSTSGQPPASDTIVNTVADEMGLTLMSPDQLPRGGTYWWVMPGGSAVPTPCPPPDANIAIYQVADGQFLADTTGGQVVVRNSGRLGLRSGTTLASAVQAQASGLIDLINQIQDNAAIRQLRMVARALGMDFPGFGDGGGDGSGSGSTNSNPIFTIDTNLLWLEITNVSNGWSYLNLNSGTNQFTNNQVFAILTKTNLLDASWTIEQEVWPTDPNCQPFTVPNYDRQILFFKAMDWTGVTENGNTVPDWWLWEYFGTTALSDTNLDANGKMLVYDYTNNRVPAVYSFKGLIITNNYVNTSSPTVQLDVTGRPYSIAILIDDTNYLTDAVWNTYSSTNIVVPLGINQGWHEVMIGLRGFSDDPLAAIWQSKRLKLDWTSPTLVITSPTNGTVDVPLIQLQGYSPEALSQISYDLNNAAGTVSNQTILILNQYYDTNTKEFTTNKFQGFDIFLTNGVNTITLHGADLAGNVTTLVTNFTVDYFAKTNPPNVQILWPQSGSLISGSTVTVRGQVDDATVIMTAVLNGNTVNGIVERNGRFWLENLPILSGANTITITANDVAGNQTVTNLTLTQSPVAVTINALYNTSQLWQPTVNLTGTISDPSYSIWVNGVQGTNNSGAWNASNVPVPPGGVASFTVTVYPPDEAPPAGSGGNGVNPPSTSGSSSIVGDYDKPGSVAVDSDPRTIDETDKTTVVDPSGQSSTSTTEAHCDIHWQAGIGGAGDRSGIEYYNNETTYSDIEHFEWDGMGSGTDTQVICDYWIDGVPLNLYTNTASFSVSIANQHCNVSDSYDSKSVIAGNNYTIHKTFKRTGQTTLLVHTGGKSTPGKMSLWQFTGAANKAIDKIGITGAPGASVSCTQINIGGKGYLGPDGNLYVTLPDGQDIDVTASVAGLDDYQFSVSGQKYTITIFANNNDLSVTNPVFCLGQKVIFALNGLPGSVVNTNMVGQWNLSPKYVNETYAYSSTCTSYRINSNLLQNSNQTSSWFVSGQSGHASVGLNLQFKNGQYASVAANGDFTVIKPSIVNFIYSFQSGFNANDASASASCNWSAKVRPPDNFSGYAKYVQLVKRNTIWNAVALGICVGKPPDTTGGHFLLDNSNPYPDPGTPTRLTWNNYSSYVNHSDSPGYGTNLCDSIFVDDHFETYLQFQPDGGIPVTIDRIDWGWSGNAIESNHSWSWSFPTSGPTENRNDDSFPVWSQIYHN